MIMKIKTWTAVFVIFLFALQVVGQPKNISEKEFFLEEKPIEMNLSTDIKGLLSEKSTLNYVNAEISCKMPDNTVMEGQVKIKPRGKFRKDNCRSAPLTINFKNETSKAFSKLGTLKMVVGCTMKTDDDEDLLQEYLVYKMYNILTDKSFRVRLLRVNFNDTKGKIKSFSQYAFLIEDIDDMAKRTQCKKKEKVIYSHDNINREQGTFVYLFQYMIGNTDWSIPFYHNIKMMVDKKDTLSKPYPVAYDFDITGFVNPSYGGPPPGLGIESVTQRLYRGYKRSVEEIEAAAQVFLAKKDSIKTLINNFEPLSARSKKEMNNFLEPFFDEISSKKNLKRTFVDNALVQ